ncbi:MAG: class 1 isoprenoid biosynthesis enzyme [Bacteroidota bacterium]
MRQNDTVVVDHIGLHAKICNFRDKFAHIWNQLPTTFPVFNKTYSPVEQAIHEQKLYNALEHAQSESFEFNSITDIDPGKIDAIKSKIRLSIHEFLQSSPLCRNDGFIDKCCDSGFDFIKMAKRFDPLLTGEEIYQALRNVWIINSVQLYLGKPIIVTLSAFAYSMLYPYTDDYLDDPAVTPAEKMKFIATVRCMLSGVDVKVFNSNLKKIRNLITMIEQEYPREHYPQVYESLLEIHRAQGRSLQEHQGNYHVAETDILDISIDKGGTSVVADACLVSGYLDDDVLEFMFGLGVVLQFIDDYQDVEQDIEHGHNTIFTTARESGNLEHATNKLLHFTEWLSCGGRIFPLDEGVALSDLSLLSCRILIFEALSHRRDRLSESYVNALEPYSPLRFDCLSNLRQQIEQNMTERKSNNDSIMPTSDILKFEHMVMGL